MKIIYSNQPIPLFLSGRSIFLAGPTPRDAETPSWRPEATSILDELGYEGVVLLPEFENPLAGMDYDMQVEWEHEGLTRSNHIVFWIPRNLKNMPAFTTNVEFGRFAHYTNTYYGRPDEAPKNRYLDWYYRKVNSRLVYNNLAQMLNDVVNERFI